MAAPSVWKGILRRVGAEIGPHACAAWLEPLAAEQDGPRLRLVCPTPFHRERVRARLLERIRDCARAEAGAPLEVELAVGAVPSIGGVAGPVAPQPAPSGPPCPAPKKPTGSAPARPEAPGAEPVQPSFESFVVGPCNALAREASRAVARTRPIGFDLLYLSGEPGLGKSHLARAAAQSAREQYGQRCRYVSSEAFTSEFQACVRGQGMQAFKRRYRQDCDLLVIEDVQFLSGKRATQLELFHTIEHLVTAGRRVMLTGDRLPRDIEALDERLRSRMASGLVAELEPPDAQVRRQILRARASAGGVRLPEPCLDLLVESLRGSVRDLEGGLVQVVSMASLLNRPIDAELTRRALQKHAPRGLAASHLSLADVVEQVCTAFETTPAALASRSRRRDVLLPRQLAMYLCRRYTNASLPEIGRAFGREHSAVSNAVRVIEKRLLERAPLRYQVEALCARLERRGASG